MKPMRRLAFAVALTALGLAACGGVPPPHDIQPWLGRNAADLAREWGEPTRELTDGGQRLLVYEEVVETRTRDLSQDSSRRNAGAGPGSEVRMFSAYARSYLFWVDASGKITQTQVRDP
jgi:hypothetical protein